MKISWGSSKSPGPVPFCPQVLMEAAVLGEFHYAGVVVLVGIVPIRTKDIAIGRDGDSGRAIEGVRAVSGHAHPAERHQHFAGRAELEHLLPLDRAVRGLGRQAEDRRLVIDVAGPQVSVRVHREAVRISEQPDAKALQQPAGRIELQDWRVGIAALDAGRMPRRHGVEAAVEHPDVTVAVNMHSDDLSPLAAIHAQGKRRPALREPVGTG